MKANVINSLNKLINDIENGKVSVETIEFINDVVNAIPGDNNFSEFYTAKKVTGNFTIKLKCKNNEVSTF
ncbi:hypothetical protein [Mesoflavibacter profundi]|uniref:hypothetical protein n=1 Tax=Mesoflavibacter profundi TaxID=2708110 RepID=UPI0035187301